jgi:hypothetical protein
VSGSVIGLHLRQDLAHEIKAHVYRGIVVGLVA